MPLYMDLHIIENITVEEVKKAHIADLTIQKKYGVKYAKYWVNEKAGMVFCLMDGPDKKTCELVHQEAHGDIACNIVEVQQGEYEFFMGHGIEEETDPVKHNDGTLDTGYRAVLYVDMLGTYFMVKKSEDIILKAVKAFRGREVSEAGDGIMAVFNACSPAVLCAQDIRIKVLNLKKKNREKRNYIELQMGISAGTPVTKTDSEFAPIIQQAKRLCQAAKETEILASPLVNELMLKSDKGDSITESPLKTVRHADEKFLDKLVEIIESRLGEEGFNVENFARQIGLSRPQLYRKTTSVTGRSPNDFIKELRMRRAAKLLKRQDGNISEVALEVGFNNPSYFAKCFRARFGKLPSAFCR